MTKTNGNGRANGTLIGEAASGDARRPRFPKTLAAVRAGEDLGQKLTAAQFAIGDALIAECGPPGPRGVNNGALDKLKTCAAELKRLGFSYSLEHLRDLRATAASFKDGDRSPSFPWTVRSAAGDPETLSAAARKAKSESLPLTAEYVKKFKKLKERGQRSEAAAAPSADNAARAFRTAASDARSLAEDALYHLARARPTDRDELMKDAQSVVAAWRRVIEALTGEPMAVRVCLAETEAQADAAHAILREHIEVFSFIPPAQVLERQRKRGLALALAGDEVVGCACFSIRRDRVAVINEIAAARFAARRGVGAALINWLLDHARAQDAVAIQLKCTADNDAGNAFYAKVGFTRWSEELGKQRALVVWRMDLVESVAVLEAAE